MEEKGRRAQIQIQRKREGDLRSRSLPTYLVGAAPSSSSPDTWRSRRARKREQGGRRAGSPKAAAFTPHSSGMERAEGRSGAREREGGGSQRRDVEGARSNAVRVHARGQQRSGWEREARGERGKVE
jgi:hypothetical protein